MKKLTFADIKEQGLHLTKAEAIELHPGISHIAQRGSEEQPTDVFNFDPPKEKQHAKAGGIGSMTASTGFEPNPKKEEPAKPETKKQRAEREALEAKAKIENVGEDNVPSDEELEQSEESAETAEKAE